MSLHFMKFLDCLCPAVLSLQIHPNSFISSPLCNSGEMEVSDWFITLHRFSHTFSLPENTVLHQLLYHGSPPDCNCCQMTSSCTLWAELTYRPVEAWGPSWDALSISTLTWCIIYNSGTTFYIMVFSTGCRGFYNQVPEASPPSLSSLLSKGCFSH